MNKSFHNLQNLIISYLSDQSLEKMLNSSLISLKRDLLLIDSLKKPFDGQVYLNGRIQNTNESFKKNVAFCATVLDLDAEKAASLVNSASSHSLSFAIHDFYMERESLMNCYEIMLNSNPNLLSKINKKANIALIIFNLFKF